MKGLSHVAMGQFYEGIKAQTKVMLNDPLPGQKASPEYLKVKYLRGKLELDFLPRTLKVPCSYGLLYILLKTVVYIWFKICAPILFCSYC